MSLVDFVQRLGGAVNGAAATLLKYRAVLFFDPAWFDVDDVPDVRLNGSAADPGIAEGYIRVKVRASALGGAGVQLGTGTPAKVSNDPGGAGDAPTAAPFNHSHQIDPASASAAGSMSDAHFILVDGATATATADKVMKWGPSAQVNGATFRVKDGVDDALIIGPLSAGKTQITSPTGDPISIMTATEFDSAPVSHVPFALDSGTTVDLNVGARGNKLTVLLGHNATFNEPTGFPVGGWIDLFIRQDTGAPFTASFAPWLIFADGLSSSLIGNALNEADYLRIEQPETGIYVCVIHVMYVIPE